MKQLSFNDNYMQEFKEAEDLLKPREQPILTPVDLLMPHYDDEYE